MTSQPGGREYAMGDAESGRRASENVWVTQYSSAVLKCRVLIEDCERLAELLRRGFRCGRYHRDNLQAALEIVEVACRELRQEPILFPHQNPWPAPGESS